MNLGISAICCLWQEISPRNNKYRNHKHKKEKKNKISINYRGIKQKSLSKSTRRAKDSQNDDWAKQVPVRA